MIIVDAARASREMLRQNTLKFQVEVVDHAHKTDAMYISAKSKQYQSDHLPIAHSESIAMTWNTLNRCSTSFDAERGIVKRTNNGFIINETIVEYKNRFLNNLSYLGEFIRRHNADPLNIPVKIACLQETSKEVIDVAPADGKVTLAQIDSQLKNINFTICSQLSEVVTTNQQNTYLVQEYGNKKSRVLMTAYDATKVEYRGVVSLPKTICEQHLEHNCFQASQFFDKEAQKLFIVVNVHQDWDLVNIATDLGKGPVAAHDIYNILEYFHRMDIPCIVTGDFNTKNIGLTNEAGKAVININANVTWNIPNNVVNKDACDHIIMNEKYCRVLYPALLKNRLETDNSNLIANNSVSLFATSINSTRACSPNAAPLNTFMFRNT